MLSRLLTRKKKGGVPLYLNVYDLSSVNGYLYWLGLGVYHSAVEAHGMEYAFGAHDLSSSGIFAIEPQSCPGFQFRRRIKLGTIQLDAKDFKDFMVELEREYSGNTYHLVGKNCNHFCNDVCLRLTGSSIPGWVNRLAKLGTLCICFLPVELHATKVEAAIENVERKELSRGSPLRRADSFPQKLRRRCRKVSCSMSHIVKGRCFPWDWKHPTLSRMKFRKL